MRVPNQFPTIGPDQHIALIGEAPGEQEEHEGKPFVGYSGSLLNRVCAVAGITCSACFVGNVFQHRPPNNKLFLVPKDDPRRKEGLDNLRSDLAKYNPNLIVALGETASEVICGKAAVSKWRGSILPTLGFGPKCIPTFHPAFILRNYAQIPVLEFDLRKAKNESKTRELPVLNRTFYLQPSTNEAIEFLHKISNRESTVAIDFETYRPDGFPICLGFAPSSTEAMCIPFSGGNISDGELPSVLHAIQRFMQSPAKKVFHNANFDLSVLFYWLRIVPTNLYMDTMLAWHACYPELKKSLAFVNSVFTKQPYYKGMHKESEEEDDEKAWSPKVAKDLLWQYNCIDCVVTRELVPYLEKEMTELNAWAGFNTDMASLPIALYMTLLGTKLNYPAMFRSWETLQKEVDRLQVIIKGLYGVEINTKSPKQMKEVLYEKLKMPIQYSGRGADKRVSTDVNAMLNLARLGYPQVMPLLKNRKLRTAQGFFFVNKVGDVLVPDMETIYDDGRIHPGFNVAGTKTGRWSSSSSILRGRNMMNIPDEDKIHPEIPGARVHYVADQGKVLIGWDKAQAESRVVAYKAWLLTGDDSYKRLVEGATKIHVWFGHKLIDRGVFKITKDALKSGVPEYDISKQGIHANSYGMGPQLFSDNILKKSFGEIVVPVWQAKQIHDTLFQEIPAIPAWQNAINQRLNESKVMYTAFGRVGIFWERPGEELNKKYYAFEPQSTVGDDVARSIQDIFRVMPSVQPLQQNYDSFLGQCDKAIVKEVLAQMKPLAEQPIHLTNWSGTKSYDLVIPVVMKVGENWEEMDELPK